MANEQFNSLLNNDDLIDPVRTAVKLQAYAQSLFLSGDLIDIMPATDGAIDIPYIDNEDNIAPTTISTEPATGIDLPAQTLESSLTNVKCDIVGVNTLVRRLGNIDQAMVSNLLTRRIVKAFDAKVFTALGTSANTTVDTDPVTVESIMDNAALLRAKEVDGQINCILNTAKATELKKNMVTVQYAGGEVQSDTLRRGIIGTIDGVNIYESSRVPSGTIGYIFSDRAFQIGMQGGLDVDTIYWPPAVGTYITATIHAVATRVFAAETYKLVNV